MYVLPFPYRQLLQIHRSIFKLHPFCYLFATSGGSGIERAAQSLQAHCPSAEWQPGKLVNPANAAAWAKSL